MLKAEILEGRLSRELRNKAMISPAGDYGWKKEDALSAVSEIVTLNYALIGCEVWAVLFERDEKVLAALDGLFLTVERVYINQIPCRGGEEKLFNMAVVKRENESWGDFVARAAKETKDFIISSAIEEEAEENLKEAIFYNPVFIDEEGYKLLRD